MGRPIRIALGFVLLFASFSCVGSALKIGPEESGSYRRGQWRHWTDPDGNCQNTRTEVLLQHALGPVRFRDAGRCQLASGSWVCPYSGRHFTDPGQMDIDHIVPLAEAARSGGQRWSERLREQFANDPENLLPVDRRLNREKGDSDPARWLPETNTCPYIRRWVSVKQKYRLQADPREMQAIRASGCLASGQAYGRQRHPTD